MDDDELRARNLVRVDAEEIGIELPPGYMVVLDITPMETLLGVPDPDGYPPVLLACDPSHEDYDPAGNDQEPTDG